VGNYKLIAELYDKYETELYDSEIRDFKVLSEVGPFDLLMDVLPGIAKPEEKIPILLSMLNNGEKGSDVKVRVIMECFDQSNILQEFFVFLAPGRTTEKAIDMPTCKEVGLHRVVSELSLWDRVWASSINQIYLNNTYYSLKVEHQEIVELAPGESKLLNVYVENIAQHPVNNLKILVEGIPLNWISTEPQTIIYVEPNGTGIFIVNITAPRDAEVKEYPLKLFVAGDETLTKDEVNLKIAGEAVLPEFPYVTEESKLSLLQLINNYRWIILASVLASLTIGGIFVFNSRTRSRRWENYEKRGKMLRRLRDAIRR
jgi:hypothetical protein